MPSFQRMAATLLAFHSTFREKNKMAAVGRREEQLRLRAEDPFQEGTKRAGAHFVLRKEVSALRFPEEKQKRWVGLPSASG